MNKFNLLDIQAKEKSLNDHYYIYCKYGVIKDDIVVIGSAEYVVIECMTSRAIYAQRQSWCRFFYKRV